MYAHQHITTWFCRTNYTVFLNNWFWWLSNLLKMTQLCTKMVHNVGYATLCRMCKPYSVWIECLFFTFFIESICVLITCFVCYFSLIHCNSNIYYVTLFPLWMIYPLWIIECKHIHYGWSINDIPLILWIPEISCSIMDDR